MKKGLKFIPIEEPSSEAIVKLNKLIIDRDLRIEKSVVEYRRSKEETLSYFSKEFRDSDAMLNPIVVHTIELLRQGHTNIYKIMEFVMTQFVKKDKEQFDVMKQLVKNYGSITFTPEKE